MENCENSSPTSLLPSFPSPPPTAASRVPRPSILAKRYSIYMRELIQNRYARNHEKEWRDVSFHDPMLLCL